jgi:hypothetical protein
LSDKGKLKVNEAAETQNGMVIVKIVTLGGVPPPYGGSEVMM